MRPFCVDVLPTPLQAVKTAAFTWLALTVSDEPTSADVSTFQKALCPTGIHPGDCGPLLGYVPPQWTSARSPAAVPAGHDRTVPALAIWPWMKPRTPTAT